MGTLDIAVRPPRPQDAPGLARVHEEAWSEAYAGVLPALALRQMIARRGDAWWRSAVRRSRKNLRVLCFGDEVAGYAAFGPARSLRDRGAGEITELYLAPVYQGLGLGERLFMTVKTEIAARGYRRLVVRCLADNARATRFYAARGGRVIASGRENVGGKDLASVLFGWTLKN